MVKAPIQKSVLTRKMNEIINAFRQQIDEMTQDYEIFKQATKDELSFDQFKILLANYQELQDYKGFDIMIGYELIKSKNHENLNEEAIINKISKDELKILSYMPDLIKDFETIDKYYYNLLGLITENSEIQLDYMGDSKNFNFKYKNKKYTIIGFIDLTTKIEELNNTYLTLEEVIKQL